MKIVFLHGLGQTPAAWDQVIQHVGLDNYWSLPLFDQLVTTADLTLSNLNQLISTRLARIHEPYLLCGLSLGGILALMQAQRPSPLLKGLIVSGAQVTAPNRGLLYFQNLVFHLLPGDFFRNLGITRNQALRLIDSIKTLNLLPRLKEVRIPAAIICGEKDCANIKAARLLNNQLAESTLTIIPDGKHELNVKNPEAFAKVVETFVNSYDF